MQFNNQLTSGLVKEKVLMAIEHRHRRKGGSSLFVEQPSFHHIRPEKYLEGKVSWGHYLI